MAETGLNDLQVEVLRLFFSLPESHGFVLAGGAGLVAAGLSERPTEDIDLFSARGSIQRAGDALESASNARRAPLKASTPSVCLAEHSA